MPSFSVSIDKLKSVSKGSRINDISSTRAVYLALCDVSQAIPTATDSELVATSAIATLEDIFLNREIVMSKALQTKINSVFVDILSTTPGYAVRNVINSLLSVVGQKNLPAMSKECAVFVIGNVMEKRSFDLGSMMTDVVSALTKLMKGSEIILRVAALGALKCICDGGGALLNDCHAEIIRTSAKLVNDRSVEARTAVAHLVASVASSSSGCTSVSADLLFGVALKGLEDEAPGVQESFAYAVALTYAELMQAHLTEQEKAKIGIARGGATDGDNAGSSKDVGRRVSLMKFKELSSVKEMLSSGLGKRNSEEFDFRSVVKSMLKMTTRAAHCHLKAAHVLSIQFFIKMAFSSLDTADIEWLFLTVLSSLAEPPIVALTYEDIVYFRTRLFHLLRTVSSQISEISQLKLAGYISLVLLDEVHRTEHEIQLAFSVLGQLIAALGEVSSAAVSQVYQAASANLNHSSFGVRASATHVLVGLATAVPALASVYFSKALSAAREQVALLLKHSSTIADVESDAMNDTSATDLGIDLTLAVGGGQDSPVADTGLRVPPGKSPKDIERLRTMFNFHGHILLVSTFLKQEKNISTGLPKTQVLDAFDFGLEMLVLEIFTVDVAMRHIVCSIIRAGSLIISSCLNMGFRVVNSRISKLLSSCSDILFATTNEQTAVASGPDVSAIVANTTTYSASDLLYELMSVEAALVCLSALLWFCPESLVFNEHYMELVVDGLDIAFHAIKGKYQSKFRSHFRFRTLHVILMECYSWLPNGSFPSTCQQLFVEGLRTFRDSISSGFECTGLSNCVLVEHRILSISNCSRGNCAVGENPTTENILMLRLEQHAVALQKKESEAFLASFTKDNGPCDRYNIFSNDTGEPLSPCAFIDSRTVDAAIALVGATFGPQSDEFQNKAIELCSQILAQVQKSANSVGIFTSDEEKKRRDRHALLSTKNTVALLFNIVESFPQDASPGGRDSRRNWVSGVSEKLFDLLATSTSFDIRSVAVNALCKLCAKPVGEYLMEPMVIKIIQCVKASIDKKGEVSDSSCGYIIALSSLWSAACDKPTLQAAISTIILDTLKHFEHSFLFRGCVVLALSCIVRSKAVGQGCNDVQETVSLITRVCEAAEGHLLCSAGNGNNEGMSICGDFNLLLACLQRLINAAVSIMMEIDPTSHLMFRLFQLWETIRISLSHISVERECIEFIVGATMFPTEALPFRTSALYLRTVICRRSDVNIEVLLAAVAGIRALIIRNSKAVCEIGIDVELFKLLDWAVACASPLCTAPYWGIELHNGLSGVIGSTRSLQLSIESALDAIVGIDVQQRPLDASVRWVLLCRSIALGISGSSKSETNTDIKQSNVGGDIEEPADDYHQNSLEGGASKMTYQQFAAWKREKGASKASALLSPRCRLRCVALRCSTAAILGAGPHSAHYDLKLCRSETQNNLDRLPTGLGDDILNDVPCYLSMFLQDIINMACACAAYTIEDNKQTALQADAIDFLSVVVTLFGDSKDPDVLEHKSREPTKILELYMAQIVSALRPCLTARWCPALLLISGGLVCDLIRGNLLTDGAVLRRLLKLLTGNCRLEQEGPYVRAPVSNEVAEEIATISHVVSLTNLSRAYILSFNVDSTQTINQEIKTVISSSIGSSLEKLSAVWESVCLDGARLLQGQKRWPKSIQDTTDPRRGGATYSSMAENSKIRSYYEFALPFVAVARSFSMTVKENSNQIPALFYIFEAVLENLAALPNPQYEHKLLFRHAAQTGGMVRLSRSLIEPMIYSGLACIAKHYVPDLDDVSCTEQISDWVRILLFLCRDIIPHRASSIGNSAEYVFLCSGITDMLESILPVVRVAMKSKNSAVKYEELLNWTWMTTISLLNTLFIGVVNVNGGSSGLISSCHHYASSVNDLKEAVEITDILFPEVQSCPCIDLFDNERLNAVVQSALLQKIAAVAVDLCYCYDSAAACEFLIHLLAAAMVRLGFHCDFQDTGPARKETLALILKLQRMPSANTSSSRTQSRSSMISSFLLNQLIAWLNFYVDNPAKFQTASLSPTHHLSEVIETIFSTWISLYREDNEQEVADSWQFVSLLLLDSYHGAGVIEAFQVQLMELLQKYFSFLPPFMTGFMFSCIFPAVILRLTSLEGFAQLEFGQHIIKFLFFALSNAPSLESKNILLQLMLSPLCATLSYYTAECDIMHFCGANFIEIARINPESFKVQVALLSDAHRSILQNSMRFAISQQHQGVKSGPNTAIAEAGIRGALTKKIDLSRYNRK